MATTGNVCKTNKTTVGLFIRIPSRTKQLLQTIFSFSPLIPAPESNHDPPDKGDHPPNLLQNQPSLEVVSRKVENTSPCEPLLNFPLEMSEAKPGENRSPVKLHSLSFHAREITADEDEMMMDFPAQVVATPGNFISIIDLPVTTGTEQIDKVSASIKEIQNLETNHGSTLSTAQFNLSTHHSPNLKQLLTNCVYVSLGVRTGCDSDQTTRLLSSLIDALINPTYEYKAEWAQCEIGKERRYRIEIGGMPNHYTVKFLSLAPGLGSVTNYAH